jgi:hypothetical protein
VDVFATEGSEKAEKVLEKEEREEGRQEKV